MSKKFIEFLRQEANYNGKPQGEPGDMGIERFRIKVQDALENGESILLKKAQTGLPNDIKVLKDKKGVKIQAGKAAQLIEENDWPLLSQFFKDTPGAEQVLEGLIMADEFPIPPDELDKGYSRLTDLIEELNGIKGEGIKSGITIHDEETNEVLLQIKRMPQVKEVDAAGVPKTFDCYHIFFKDVTSAGGDDVTAREGDDRGREIGAALLKNRSINDQLNARIEKLKVEWGKQASAPHEDPAHTPSPESEEKGETASLPEEEHGNEEEPLDELDNPAGKRIRLFEWLKVGDKEAGTGIFDSFCELIKFIKGPFNISVAGKTVSAMKGNPGILEDHMPGIIVKIDGVQVDRETFIKFIDEHKDEFVKAYNDAIDKICEQEREKIKAKKQGRYKGPLSDRSYLGRAVSSFRNMVFPMGVKPPKNPVNMPYPDAKSTNQADDKADWRNYNSRLNQAVGGSIESNINGTLTLTLDGHTYKGTIKQNVRNKEGGGHPGVEWIENGKRIGEGRIAKLLSEHSEEKVNMRFEGVKKQGPGTDEPDR